MDVTRRDYFEVQCQFLSIRVAPQLFPDHEVARALVVQALEGGRPEVNFGFAWCEDDAF